MTASSSSSWNEFIQQWIGRIAVTFCIVLAWEFLQKTKATPTVGDHEYDGGDRMHHGTAGKVEMEDRGGDDGDAKYPSKDKDGDGAVAQVDGDEGETETQSRSVSGAADDAAHTADHADDNDGTNKGSAVCDEVDTATPSSLPSPTPVAVEDVTAKEKSAPSTSKKMTARATASAKTAVKAQPPPIKATTNDFPGLAQFNYWYDIETSLFRIYTLGRTDDVPVVPPYVPHSYRGTVQVYVHITNSTSFPINVYWVDYSGKHIPKGKLHAFGGIWTQTTYIDHPWVFENAETQEVLLHYVPYRVIPTTSAVSTLAEDGETGMHKFELIPPTQTSSAVAAPYHVQINDPVLPFPADAVFSDTTQALHWTLLHMTRMGIDETQVDTLLKYLSNIVNEPATTKYRQVRIGSSKFASIWLSPARGILLAIGFVEVGAYAELGCSEELSRDGVQLVALAIYLIVKWKDEREQEAAQYGANGRQQPHGADGFGRQGFGRAGTMN